MNILIITSSDPYKTAGVIAMDIYNGFKTRESNRVTVLVKQWGRYPDPNIISATSYFSNYYNKIIKRVRKVLSHLFLNKGVNMRANPDYHVFDLDQSKEYISTKKILRKAKVKPDVIFILFGHSFLTFKNLYELNKITGAPIYWQLADMASFTGLCHYSWDCKRFKDDCGNCPAIYSSNVSDASYRNILYKRRYAESTNMRIIIGSDWLIDLAKISSVFKNKKITKNYLSVNSKEYYPIDNTSQIKEKFKILDNYFVIGFGANGINDKRKGIHLILEAIQNISTDKEVIFIYAGDKEIQGDFNYKTKYIGTLSRKELPDFYRVCDLFVSASLQDVGPYMLIESLMCGTPVVSFNSGFAKEFIIDDVTGQLVSSFKSEDLAQGINRMLNKSRDEIVIIRKNCNELTKEKVSIERQINKYYQLFEEDKIIDESN